MGKELATVPRTLQYGRNRSYGHALQYVLDQWHLSANDCLMVGDSESDCSAALACGMPVVLVSYGYSQGRNLAALGPDAIIDSIGEIVTMSG